MKAKKIPLPLEELVWLAVKEACEKRSRTTIGGLWGTGLEALGSWAYLSEAAVRRCEHLVRQWIAEKRIVKVGRYYVLNRAGEGIEETMEPPAKKAKQSPISDDPFGEVVPIIVDDFKKPFPKGRR